MQQSGWDVEASDESSEEREAREGKRERSETQFNKSYLEKDFETPMNFDIPGV